MEKKQTKKELKKRKIAGIALELFFIHGYEGTSMRMISQKMGNEVGLVYYYFESKDDIFEEAIHLFFESYEEKMREISEAAVKDPNQSLSRYIIYIENATKEFRDKYLQQLHWSVLGAIREYTMQIMKKYVKSILDIYVEQGILEKMSSSTEAASDMIAYGVGASILYRREAEYRKIKPEIMKIVARILETEVEKI